MVVIDGARKGQSKEGRGPVRPMLLTSGLFIGANQDSSDGFVGCMRALVLNGVNIDLQVLFFFVKSHCRFHDFHKFSFFYQGEAVKTDKYGKTYGVYGVGIGCTGKCDPVNPCMNGGVCKEGYDHFDCDCRWTPFKGPICADEIGVNMRTNYMIKYDFKGNYKSTIAEKIHVGFTTTDPKGFLIGAYR